MPAPLRLRLEQELREAVAERYEHARTPVERTNCQVVLLTDEGRTVTEIAWLVHSSYKTVANTSSIMRQKLGVRTSAELVRLAIEHSLT